jgi:hypothetical protein
MRVAGSCRRTPSDEGDEALPDFRGRGAGGEVVVPGIHQHRSRLIPNDQAVEVLHAVGELRTAETALYDAGSRLELRLEVAPEPN